MSDDFFYKLIADELEQNRPDRVIWTRSLGESGGDPEKTKALYIKLRLADLKKAAAPSTPPPELHLSGTESGTDRAEVVNHGLVLLRSDLAKKLAMNKTSSFYSVLNISPDASDAIVASAISDYEARVASGIHAAKPEFKYAIETLGNPRARENYDRKLLERLTTESPTEVRHRRQKQDDHFENDNTILSLWATRKTAVIVASLSLFVVGYMVLGFYKTHTTGTVQEKEIDAKVLQTNRTADNDATRADTERVLVEGVLKNSERAIDTSAQLQNRSLDIRQDAENHRRQEMEYRANANNQILEMQRQDQERRIAIEEKRLQDSKQREQDRKIANEKKYWTCMNLALDKMSSDNANSRCAGYR